MRLDQNILKSILATVLTLALFLPATVEFSHIFEDHPHALCTDHSVHLHEQKTDCLICHFHLASFNFTPLASVESLAMHLNFKPEFDYLYSSQTHTLQHPDSRGSPLLS